MTDSRFLLCADFPDPFRPGATHRVFHIDPATALFIGPWIEHVGNAHRFTLEAATERMEGLKRHRRDLAGCLFLVEEV